MKRLFFDLDGTITDPALGITNSVKYALAYYGIEEKTENLLRFIGPPLSDSFEQFYGFSHEQALEAVAKYREYFSTRGLFENKVYPGMEAFLQDLKNQGFKLYIATSKPEVFAKKIIEHFNLSSYFDEIFGASYDESRNKKADVIAYGLEKLHITSDEVLMIGDRLHDIDGAHAHQIKAIGVLYGYGSFEEMKEHQADFVVENLEQLKQVIEQNK